MANKNRNDRIIKTVRELAGEARFSQYRFNNHFMHLCNIIPNRGKERLEIVVMDKTKIAQTGLVYVFVVKDKIFKIGQSIGDFSSRVRSYNCGKNKFRDRGTCSTTNWFILQSILAMNCTVQVHVYFATAKTYKIFDEVGKDHFPSTKIIERKIIKDFVEIYGKKPIANTQS